MLSSELSEPLKGNDDTHGGQETHQIRFPDFPFDHRRRYEDRRILEKADDLRSGRFLRCCFLYTERKGEAHHCVEEREGSHHRHSERERFLRRRLLLLAHFGKEGTPETVIAKISHETLAEMVGTTRSRVSFFMNRFRKLGFIDYRTGDELQVHSSLLNIVLHD